MSKHPHTSRIKKQSDHGIGYSVVDLDGVSHVFVAAVPRSGSTLQQQADDALQTIETVIDREGTRGQIIKQAVFMRDWDQMAPCRRILRDYYGDQMPATTYIPQPPCCGKLISIEALGVGRGQEEVAIERISEQLVVAWHNGISWIHCGHVTPKTESRGVYERSMSALEQMEQLLRSRNIGFHQVIRTWFYLGDITGMEGPARRYSELNRARTDRYKKIRFAPGMAPPHFNHPVYPASTGIGTSNQDVVMDAIAVDAEPDRITLVPLENPCQTSAFQYPAEYSSDSPKFVRAMALTAGACCTIFVSGTASITDSETRFEGNVERQTEQTLDNIESLISEANLVQHGYPGLGATLDDLAFVRVYIKRQEDYEKTRAVCEARLGELPTIYAIADICRPELLVEIEAIAFSNF
ncbi:MAG: dioxygenase [Pirellulales bacterium]|nr:dioxygenase [Pirellulales bacterium]